MKKFEVVTKPLSWFISLFLVAFMAGCGNSILGGEGASSAQNSSKAITAFSFVGFPSAPAAINETAKTIAVTLPTGTPVTGLTANYTTLAPTVTIGTVVQTSGGNPTNNFTSPVTYKVTAADGTTASYVVTVTVTPPLSSIKTITAFSFVGYLNAPVTITESAHTIAVTLPTATSVTGLTANYTTIAPIVKIGTAVQTSGGNPTNNFTTPVTYTVTAADGTTSSYLVTVTVTPALSSIKTITAFSFVGFPSAPVTITANTIGVTLPTGTSVTSLTANYTTLAPSVKIGTVVQTSGGIPTNNFTTPVTYTVTAADGTTASYVVSVTVPTATNSINTITAFSFVGFAGTPGVISGLNIAVSLPFGTPVTSLTANYTTVAPSVKIGSVAQTSGGVPANDFTSPVTYTVTASDGTSVASYVVTVNVATVAAVNLATAGHFAILTKSGITDVPSSVITGDIGASPIAGTAIGVPCSEVTGFIYEVDTGYTVGTCTNVKPTDSTVSQSVLDMGTAYTDGFTRTAGVGSFLNVGAGILTNQTLAPGVYTFNTTASNVTIPTNLTFNGGASDVWIIQVAGTLDISSNMQILLTGGAQAKNIFWIVAGAVSLNTNSHFEGVILAQTSIAMFTSATANSRLLAQTAVTLQQNTVTQPAP